MRWVIDHRQYSGGYGYRHTNGGGTGRGGGNSKGHGYGYGNGHYDKGKGNGHGYNAPYTLYRLHPFAPLADFDAWMLHLQVEGRVRR